MSHLQAEFVMKNVIKVPGAPRRLKGTKKMCSKGKSCRASCISRDKTCLIELGEEVGRSLSKIRRIRATSVVAAHPLLSKDFSEKNIRRAIDSIGLLDKDAKRRAAVLVKILNKTKTVFIDWKDDETNRKIFIATASLLHSNAPQEFDKKASKKTWAGVAFRGGSSMIKASPGFSPNVKQIKTLIERQLKELTEGRKKSFSIGKGTKAQGNNPFVTMVHELGHHGHFRGGETRFPSSIKNVSVYAETDHYERFAELFTAYVFAGPKLRSLYPTEYEAVESTLKKANLL